MHFIYWDHLRKGKSQVEVATMYNVSRQAVNKTVKSQNQKVMVRLLELARSIGALVEWQDETKGLLVGIVPQLEDRVCIIIVDANDLDRVFYNNINDHKIKYNLELVSIARNVLNLNIPSKANFDLVLQTLVNN